MTRIALVGCGAVSRLFYSPALRECQKRGAARVISVVDASPEAASQVAAMLGCEASESLDRALAMKPGLVIIATPPHLHATQSIQCLQAGVNVICEKPLATCWADANRMLETAKLAGKVLASGHYKRHFAAAEQIRALIAHKQFGQLNSISLQEGGKFAWPAASDSFFRPEATPGGVLYDIGIHAIDLMIWWLGEPSLDAYEDDSSGGLEANASLKLRWPMQSIGADLYFSRDWPTANKWRFFFERATVVWKVNDGDHLELSFPGDIPYVMKAHLHERSGTAAPTHPQSFTKHLLNVLDAIRTGQPPRALAAEAAIALKIVEEAYRKRRFL